jgi:hypothetical protein
MFGVRVRRRPARFQPCWAFGGADELSPARQGQRFVSSSRIFSRQPSCGRSVIAKTRCHLSNRDSPERSGLSLDKEKLSAMSHEAADQDAPQLSIRDPYIFDYKPNDLWIEFPFAPAYLDIIRVKTSGEIVSVMEANARLALSELYLQDRDGFFLLDDPFTDMDTSRRAAAIHALGAFAEKHQVLFLTCHPNHARELENVPGAKTLQIME